MVCHFRNGFDSPEGQNGLMLHLEIRKAREAAGWSQARLAEAIGIGPTDVSKIETGRKLIRADEVQKIADVNNRKPQAAVRAQYHPDAGSPGKAVTLLRQFYPPNLLVTNSTGANAAPLYLDHDDVQILGVVVSVHRAFNG